MTSTAANDSSNTGDAQASSTAATSRSLIDRVRQDDQQAWDRLVTLYAPLVYRWCRRWNLQAEDVADVVQDVFQAVAKNMAKFRKERPGDTFRGWLRTITRSKVHDRFRRSAREPEGVGGTVAHEILSQLPDAEPAEDSEADDKTDRHELFHRGLELIKAEFEPRTWRAFWRTAVDGQKPKDVGEELSMTPGAVRVAKSRVLHRLRDELGDLID